MTQTINAIGMLGFIWIGIALGYFIQEIRYEKKAEKAKKENT